MPEFVHGDVTLAYDDTGGDGTPITLLHGLSMSRATWARFVPDLEQLGLRVIRVDQRGHGGSSHAGHYVLDTYIDDTIAFLEQVVGEPSFLVGHSLGGVIAHGIAQARPDLARGALLEDPPLFVVDRMNEGVPRAEASRVAATFPLVQQITRDMQSRKAPIEEYEAMLQNVPALNYGGTMAEVYGTDWIAMMARSLQSLDPEIFTTAIDGEAIGGRPDPHAHVDIPLVVLRADPAFGPAFSAEDEAIFLRANPEARVITAEGASHQIHDEQPERFRTELTSLVASP